MATEIDALVVTLGLDPKNFTEQQRKVLDQFKRNADEAKKRAREVEALGNRVADTFSHIQNKAIGLLSVFVGGRGVKEFVAWQTQVSAETGRMSRVLDTSTQTLSAWRGAANVTGGSAEGMTASIQGLVSQFQTFSLTGESSVIPWFRALNVQIADGKGKMRGFDDIMLDLAERFSHLDPAKAAAFGKALGFDDGTINLLIKGRVAVTTLLEEQKKLGLVTKEEADSAELATKNWRSMEQAATSLGRSLINTFSPAITTVLDKTTELFKLWNQTPEQSTKGLEKQMSKTLGEPPTWLRNLFGLDSNGEFHPDPNSPLGQLVSPGSAPASTSRTLSGYRSQIRAKPGSGTTSPAIASLAQALQNDIPGLNRFTAFDDTYHKGTGSKHAQGLALDFSITDAKKSAFIAEQVRERLRSMGIDGKVIDEYRNPSAGATGGHIHVQFNSQSAADQYRSMVGLQQQARAGTAAGSKAADGAGGGVTNIDAGPITVVTKATDAEGIAKDMVGAVKRQSITAQANYGPGG